MIDLNAFMLTIGKISKDLLIQKLNLINVNFGIIMKPLSSTPNPVKKDSNVISAMAERNLITIIKDINKKFATIKHVTDRKYVVLVMENKYKF